MGLIYLPVMIRTVSSTPHRSRAARCVAVVAATLAVVSTLMATTSPKRDDAPTRAVPAYRQASTVAILPVHGEIDRVTLWSLERRAAIATRRGATAFVIELDTPGGDAMATLDICNLIKTEFPPNTVAWIRPNAYSAGTFIALAAREIVFAPNARMGDAAPISPFMALPPTERAKIESPLLTEIIDSARRNHYDEHLARSFVTLSGGLWLVENQTTGERAVVDREEYEAIFGSSPRTTSAPVREFDQNIDFTPRFMGIFERPEGRGGPEITAEEIARQIEFEQQLPPVRTPLTAADAGEWQLIARVLDDGELLTLTTEAATFFGFSAATIASDEELRQWFGATTLLRLEASIPERLVAFLISLPVRITLIAIFLIALFVELAMPGFGVFGATALVALMLLVGAPWLLGIAHWWTLLLILGGVALIVVELFITPGLGLPGILGGLMILLGMVSTFISGDTAADGRSEVLTGMLATLGGCLIAGVAIWLISRQMQGWPILNRLMLTAELGTATGPPRSSRAVVGGTTAGTTAATGSVPSDATAFSRMIDSGRALEPGEIGAAVTELRPTGRADFGGRIVEVLSVDGFIPRGARVRVTNIGQFEVEVEVVT